MGCTASTEHPSIYNERVGKNNKKELNGTVPTQVPKNNNAGDYSQYQLAKHNRSRSQKSHQLKTLMAADQMAERLIDERELLSLGARSRGTSRNTSRTTSPNGTRRHGHSKTIKDETPMTPVAELTRGESLKRDKSNERQDNEQGEKGTTKTHKKTKKHKQNKGKAKKHKNSKGGKSKTSKSKLPDSDTVDSGMDENDNLCDDNNDVNNSSDVRTNGDGSEAVKIASSDHRNSSVIGDEQNSRGETMSASQRDSAIAETDMTTDGTPHHSGGLDSTSPNSPV